MIVNRNKKKLYEEFHANNLQKRHNIQKILKTKLIKIINNFVWNNNKKNATSARCHTAIKQC